MVLSLSMVFYSIGFLGMNGFHPSFSLNSLIALIAFSLSSFDIFLDFKTAMKRYRLQDKPVTDCIGKLGQIYLNMDKATRKRNK